MVQKEAQYHQQGHKTTLGKACNSHKSLVKYMFLYSEMSCNTTCRNQLTLSCFFVLVQHYWGSLKVIPLICFPFLQATFWSGACPRECRWRALNSVPSSAEHTQSPRISCMFVCMRPAYERWGGVVGLAVRLWEVSLRLNSRSAGLKLKFCGYDLNLGLGLKFILCGTAWIIGRGVREVWGEVSCSKAYGIEIKVLLEHLQWLRVEIYVMWYCLNYCRVETWGVRWG